MLACGQANIFLVNCTATTLTVLPSVLYRQNLKDSPHGPKVDGHRHGKLNRKDDLRQVRIDDPLSLVRYVTFSTIFKVRVLHARHEMAMLTFYPSDDCCATLLKLCECMRDWVLIV